ncbi:hypothetical protein NIES3585_13460 [Nodularia sp. NIES-3585]|nr:hypothetical protein NIES3585_13460 [Nodularia sp. NIES-3585]
MTKYSSCPGCGHSKKSGLLTGAYFNIYKCKQCKHKFCSNCGRVNVGLIGSTAFCPKCGSEGYKDGECYLR